MIIPGISGIATNLRRNSMTKDEEIKVIQAVQKLVESHSGEVTYHIDSIVKRNWLNKPIGKKTTLMVVFYDNEPKQSIPGVKINGKKPREINKQQMSLNLL